MPHADPPSAEDVNLFRQFIEKRYVVIVFIGWVHFDLLLA